MKEIIIVLDFVNENNNSMMKIILLVMNMECLLKVINVVVFTPRTQ
jgi:hypothetical protein